MAASTEERLGPLMIQLPRDVGHDELPRLAALLERRPRNIPCGVAVRASEFFHRRAAEQQLNRLLISHGADRVMFDVRPLFPTSPGSDSHLFKVQGEKPRRPLHVLSTADRSIVRFIGHLDTAINQRYSAAWIERLILWIKQGKTSFILVHTPDNREAPQLARHFYSWLASGQALPAPRFPGDIKRRFSKASREKRGLSDWPSASSSDSFVVNLWPRSFNSWQQQDKRRLSMKDW